MGNTTHRPGPPPGLDSSRVDRSLLSIYLNDHLAGATAGVQRARHLARATSGTPLGRAVGPIAEEIAQDRSSLLDIMRLLDLPVQRHKAFAGWLAERIGRLKGNGRLLRRSPLSTFLELELLRTAVEGKTAGWQTLHRLPTAQGLPVARLLDELLERAARQQHTLEQLRERQTTACFVTD